MIFANVFTYTFFCKISFKLEVYAARHRISHHFKSMGLVDLMHFRFNQLHQVDISMGERLKE